MDKDLDELWEEIGRATLDPDDSIAQEHFKAGLPVYWWAEGLQSDEVIKTYPDGREEVIHVEFGTRKETFVRLWKS